ncbi:helix-turn-helix domain-containing protein [Nocardioides dubius]|uniref:Helix-turn-helix domain-containing protein n=1 Tax=Nocardioides dubius TaxID=317019 RepID=A0ABN1U0U7_9ACTN
MSHSLAVNHEPSNIDELVAEAREALPVLVDQVVHDVRREISAYAGPAGGERQQVIALAVTAAANQFLDIVLGGSINARVSKLFRDMGFSEAVDGHTLEPMRRALQIANRHSWNVLRHFATKHDVHVAYLGSLGDTLFAYMHHLDNEVARGHQLGTTARHDRLAREIDEEALRDNLIQALLTEGPDTPARLAELASDAESAGWPLPPAVVVMRVSYHGEFPTIRGLDNILARTTESPALLICRAEGAEATADLLQRSGPGLRVAVSIPVSPTQTAQADRWAQRTLDLVKVGAISPKPVIQCADHHLQLWLHSEPDLRRQLVQDLLEPLLSETPNSREILSETMLAWLESRDSAPAIAARLGVHPQTIRYRWKRINEIFGTLLHDTEFVVTVTMVLKATVPLWQAGDATDVEIYRARTEVG